MNPNPSACVPRPTPAPTLLPLSALLLAGCLQPASPECDWGVVCPAGTTCDPVTRRCVVPGVAVCGNLVVEGGEDCEPGVPLQTDCQDLGCYDAEGGLGCTNDCRFDLEGCTGFCGDGRVGGGEACDGTDLGGAGCATLGYYEGDLACTRNCTHDPRGCARRCNDGQVDPEELCDRAPPPGETCLDYGFDQGRLGCSGLCTPGFEGCRRLGWTRQDPGTSAPLVAVFALDPDHAWAVGDEGTSFHLDGASWTAQETESTQNLFAVWGSGPDDVWAVGTQGEVLRWQGDWWMIQPPLGSTWLTAVGGSGPDDVIAVGASGAIHRFDGTGWSEEDAGTSLLLKGV